ncbi:amino acid ABC transporter permease [Pseudacidovorax sp. RU35E]|uniref:amino acid ABC transporter permease n=1 Tax=Pseudacidovorax sp. RU35E TaxID=1907403 RepID=UPI0009572AB9|nr:ABC transporter permease subunit [Pseudacidovorax sp. RU35E]SIR71165.1 amino acid ABC transporter membrane protein 1, PAAT family [Pseudacidovorax sp. RU35E]
MELLQGYEAQLLQGTLTTLKLAACALVLGTVLGSACCWLQLSGVRVLEAVGRTYVAVARGVPDLLIVFAVFFGAPLTLATLTGRPVEIDTFAAGVVALALSFGAYVAEIIRGSLLSVPGPQREAARMLGLSRLQTLGTVVLPQAARAALPPFGNQSIVLLKQTSIVSIVGCDELMRKAAEAAGATRQPFTMYLAAALIYLALTAMLTLCLGWAERRSVPTAQR